MNATTAIVSPPTGDANPESDCVTVRRHDLWRLVAAVRELYRTFDPARMSSLIGDVHGLAIVLDCGSSEVAGDPQPLALYEPPGEPEPFEPDDEDIAAASGYLEPMGPPNGPDEILRVAADALESVGLDVSRHRGAIDFTSPNGVEWSLELKNMTLFFAHMEDEARGIERERSGYGTL